MPGIVNRLAATETAAMLADDRTVLADHDAIGVSLDLDRPADGARADRVPVVVEANEAGLGDRGLGRVEPVEGTVRNFVRRLGMIGAKEPDDAATQRAPYS